MGTYIIIGVVVGLLQTAYKLYHHYDWFHALWTNDKFIELRSSFVFGVIIGLLFNILFWPLNIVIVWENVNKNKGIDKCDATEEDLA